MSIESFGDKLKNSNQIEAKERMAFQILLIKKMLGERPVNETDEEWRQEKINWCDKYAKIVGDIIDNTENKEIRDLILKGKKDEASNIVIELLKKE